VDDPGSELGDVTAVELVVVAEAAYEVDDPLGLGSGRVVNDGRDPGSQLPNGTGELRTRGVDHGRSDYRHERVLGNRR
jgi:hypothetical protein